MFLANACYYFKPLLGMGDFIFRMARPLFDGFDNVSKATVHIFNCQLINFVNFGYFTVFNPMPKGQNCLIKCLKTVINFFYPLNLYFKAVMALFCCCNCLKLLLIFLLKLLQRFLISLKGVVFLKVAFIAFFRIMLICEAKLLNA
ncbi:hypothetical protein GGTG_11246 [Gaeumannomyces tritici R3-111a-1]|uniref:Uncharacterized protein n=1 Tax=Gaeumannomyces tritici (strain R3-111a-1) TaxID=644352 RepID=J3PCM6_GAET3|nr:hypothetical protein GGTG_11246 [Gaeumannomyces tritici R3-111a-1]EJT71996.1 hypothetical protein GGTG_11246 [Gaeumannomyces tritici R3-111a-1]